MNKLRNKPSTPPKFETKSKPVILVDLLTRLFSKLELHTENITRLSFHFLCNFCKIFVTLNGFKNSNNKNIYIS